jgi:hypothetical protein
MANYDNTEQFLNFEIVNIQKKDLLTETPVRPKMGSKQNLHCSSRPKRRSHQI